MFKVRWTIDAQDDLWGMIKHGDEHTARAIMNAMRRAESVLSADPLHTGESRELERRIMFASPLTLIYRVLPDENLVRVLAAHLWQRWSTNDDDEN